MDYQNLVHSADDDSFSRPRSFSDASVSSGRYGYIKRFNEKLDLERKTSMKVFVRRESQVVATIEKKKVAEVLPFLRSGNVDETKDLNIKYCSVDNLVSKSPGDNDVPPPKPALPKNYRISVLSVDYKTIPLKDDSDKIQEPHPEYRHVNSADRWDSQQNTKYNTKDEKGNQLVGSVRHGRSSVSELPARSTNVLYRHFDPKYQSELLRKELDKLRTKEHVRRNSVKQKLESGARPKSTSDLHVRFADEINASEQTCAQSGTRTLTRQSKSAIIPSETQFGTGPDVDMKYKSGAKPGTLRDSEPKGKRDMNVAENVVKQQVKNSDLIRESRSAAAAYRDRGPIRSKSATIYNRNRTGMSEKQEWKTLQSGLSNSASNLRRKQNTITRFNYSSVEQKRENVRARYQQSDKRNRIESYSPGVDDFIDSNKEDSSTARKSGIKSSKTFGDNRSDEEKYAELSRQKIFHFKSSSWDSQPSQLSNPAVATTAQSNKKGLTRQPYIHVKSEITKSHISKSLLNAQTSSKTGDVRSDFRNHGSDLPFSDSECYVKNGANKTRFPKTVSNVGAKSEPQHGASSESIHGKIVLRQCRVGSDVVFGLVGLQNLSKPDSGSKVRILYCITKFSMEGFQYHDC